jgi:hypothetical protein
MFPNLRFHELAQLDNNLFDRIDNIIFRLGSLIRIDPKLFQSSAKVDKRKILIGSNKELPNPLSFEVHSEIY